MIDRAFHCALARAAHNPFLNATLSRMYTLSLRLWYLALGTIGPIRESIKGLRAMVRMPRWRCAHMTAFQQRMKAIL